MGAVYFFPTFQLEVKELKKRGNIRKKKIMTKRILVLILIRTSFLCDEA